MTKETKWLEGWLSPSGGIVTLSGPTHWRVDPFKRTQCLAWLIGSAIQVHGRSRDKYPYRLVGPAGLNVGAMKHTPLPNDRMLGLSKE